VALGAAVNRRENRSKDAFAAAGAFPAVNKHGRSVWRRCSTGRLPFHGPLTRDRIPTALPLRAPGTPSVARTTLPSPSTRNSSRPADAPVSASGLTAASFGRSMSLMSMALHPGSQLSPANCYASTRPLFRRPSHRSVLTSSPTRLQAGRCRSTPRGDGGDDEQAWGCQRSRHNLRRPGVPAPPRPMGCPNLMPLAWR
jgi:hypothetical protein